MAEALAMGLFNITFTFKYSTTPSGVRAVPILNAEEQQVTLTRVNTELSAEQLEEDLPDEMKLEIEDELLQNNRVPEGYDVHLEGLKVTQMDPSEDHSEQPQEA